MPRHEDRTEHKRGRKQETAPAYDEDVTDGEVSARWERYFQELWEARRRS